MSDDKDLLFALKSDSDAAWAEVFKKFHGPTQIFLRTYSCYDKDFEDIFQETLIRFEANVKTLDLRTNLKTYLFSVAKNVWFEVLRFRKKHGIEIDIDEVVNDEEPNHFEPFFLPFEEEFSIFEQVRDAILKIKMKNCKDLIVMRFWYKNSITDISEELNLTYSSAKSKLSICLLALKEILIEEGIKFPESKNSKEDE